MIDREYTDICITVPPQFNQTRLRNKGVIVHQQKAAMKTFMRDKAKDMSRLIWYGEQLKIRDEIMKYVDGKYHRQGIGKRLYQIARSRNNSNKMTVNSSPYAVPVYHKLGFIDTDTEQVVNGLRFIPMEYK